jgi:hypothetical protein
MYTFYRYSAHLLVRTSIKNSTSGQLVNLFQAVYLVLLQYITSMESWVRGWKAGIFYMTLGRHVKLRQGKLAKSWLRSVLKMDRRYCFFEAVGKPMRFFEGCILYIY